jgi:hypothetical protein
MKKAFFLLFLAICVAGISYANDEIRMVGKQSEIDQRHIYPLEILTAALEATIESYGPYTLSLSNESMTRDRALEALQTGTLINIHEAPTRNEWEEAAIPIRIPIRKGILGYRLFLVRKDGENQFRLMDSVDELRNLSAGLGAQWSTTTVMRALDFAIVTGHDYEGLFRMLVEGRFDYFPRGVNEVFREYDLRKDIYPNMVIESTKALYFATPTYFFVSPNYPELVDRIQTGMLEIIEDGTFDKIFYDYHDEFIRRADLPNREIFVVDNPTLTAETPIEDRSLWYVPDSEN